MPRDVVVELEGIAVQLPAMRGAARRDGRMVPGIVSLARLVQTGRQERAAFCAPITGVLLLSEDLLQVKVLGILRGFCSGVTDVALQVNQQIIKGQSNKSSCSEFRCFENIVSKEPLLLL